MLFGLALSCGLGVQVFGYSRVQGMGEESGASPAYINSQLSTLNFQPLLALAAALALTQWTHLALPLASFTRTQKVYSVGWTVGGLLVIILIADFAGRIARRRSGTVEVEK
jgi:hypothetical protein